MNYKLILKLAFWSLAVGIQSYWLIDYDNKPGELIQPPEILPHLQEIKFADKRFNLIMFLHPKCACSKASLQELQKIIAKSNNNLEVYIVVDYFKGFEKEIEESDVVNAAKNFTGVTLIRDTTGIVSNTFSAKTSGLVLLYSPQDRLIFWGGITALRGHVGDNKGEDAIVAVLNHKQTSNASTAVFGCHLSNHNDKREVL